MTRLVVVGLSGPNFHEPRSLEQTLQASVDYQAEKERQEREQWLAANCVPSDSLLSDYGLREIHCELSIAVSR